MEPKVIRLADEAHYQENGLPFKNENAARWAYRNRNSNGLGGAFKKIGKQVLIDVPAFHAAMAAQK